MTTKYRLRIIYFQYMLKIGEKGKINSKAKANQNHFL